MFDNYKEFEEIVKKRNGENEIESDEIDFTPTNAILINYYFGCKKWDDDLKIIRLPKSKEKQQDMNFVDNIMGCLNEKYGGSFVLRHIFSELTYNVHEHAFDDNSDTVACIALKEFSNEEMLEICIADYGLSIPGKFDNSNVKFSDDCNAIEKAINNFSTASNNPYERGNGLWTTIRLIIEGNEGEMLIISRKGLLYINQSDYEYRLLDAEKMFNGTLISIRLNKNEVQNIYDLIELPKKNFYRYEG